MAITPRLRRLDEGYYPCTPAGSRRLIKASILRHGPSADQPRAHDVSGFGVGAFGELPAECPDLYNLADRVQATSYGTYQATRPPRRRLTRSAREFDARGSWLRRWGCARLIIERCTKFISLGDSGTLVTAPKVDQGAKTIDNCHFTTPITARVP